MPHIAEALALPAAGFSIVKLAVDKQSGTEYACKIMALPAVGQEVGDNENTRWEGGGERHCTGQFACRTTHGERMAQLPRMSSNAPGSGV